MWRVCQLTRRYEPLKKSHQMLQNISIRLLILSFVSINLLAATFLPKEILEKADEVRNPGQSYFIEASITHKNDYSQSFYVAIQGYDHTRIETISPAKDRGRNMLMLEQNMWVFLPSIGRETRVSLNQKLMGEAANGDLSRLRWSNDYMAILIEETPEQWELLLTARREGLTYEKMRLWVQKETFYPLRAQYLTRGEKVLKEVSYENFRMMEGRMRPSRIVIQDALRPAERSTIDISHMQVRTWDSFYFHKSELGRMTLEP